MSGWAGRLLVATPLLTGPPFERAVVLLIQSDPEGALGVVLTSPTETQVGEVLPGWEALAAGPALVFSGGPVQPTAAICLGHGRPGSAPTAAYDAVLSGAGVGTVDLDAEPEDVTAAVEEVRVFAGYAGWSAGQLEAEVAEGAWWVLDALPGDAFSGQPERLWAQVLRRQGPPLAFAALYPADPTHN